MKKIAVSASWPEKILSSVIIFLSIVGIYALGVTACSHKPVVEQLPTLEQNQANYMKHCSSCHSPTRTGLMGPALIPETLGKLKKPDAIKTISEGRVATQMAGFTGQLTENEIRGLVEYIYSPLSEKVDWTEAQIRASVNDFEKAEGRSSKPVFNSDPMNLFFVVQHGDHQLSVLDGDKFEILKSFDMRLGLHGGIKYTPDGRYAFATTRDGWITKFDVYNLSKVAEVRAGLNTRNIAISYDGKILAVGNLLPANLVFLDIETLNPIKALDLVSEKGIPSKVSAVYSAPPRKSFVVALKDSPELREITWKGDVFSTKKFASETIKIPKALDDFYFNSSYSHALGASREGNGGWAISLNTKKVEAEIGLTGMPHLGSGILFTKKGVEYMATPNIKDGIVTVIDTKTWRIASQIKTKGPGFFMRSHESTPYAWVDNFMSAHKDTISIVDKETLQVVKELTPAPGKTTAHVEFTKNGKFALVSVWEDEGALLVFDSKSLELVKTIPMKKPSGKYNIYNKTHLSGGTSH